MAEWLKAAVLKIASRAIVTGVRIPLPPFFFAFLDYLRTDVPAKARLWPTKFGWVGRVGSNLPRANPI
jgi:hypothetical protein